MLLAAFSAIAQVGQEPKAPLAKDAVVVEMTSAQGADESLGRVPSVFGTQDEDISTVSWADFHPYTSNATFASDTVLGGRWTTGGSSFLYASLPSDIPNGAVVTQVVFYVKDTNAGNDFTGQLCRYHTESNGGGSPASECPLSVSTSGTPGDTVPFANTNLTILRRTDITGDGPVEVINWVLHYDGVLALDGSIQIRQVRILWRRQVSPAPASATFADVPTNFIYFRAIEALAASGITAGCATPGNFCPNANVTRGEMAAFLSRALGLHWPAF
ncbi:MAG: S-layer homology domain-containing protein [Acidobacteriota bacterium]